MNFELFKINVGEIKEEIVLKLKNDYSEFELFSSIIKDVFNNDYFGIKFTKEMISAIDSFDIYFAEKNKVNLKPISHFITSISPFNGLPFFDYTFLYTFEEDELKISLSVPKIDSESHLGKRIDEIMKIFIEYVNEDDLKKRMIEQLKKNYCENIDSGFDILEEYIKNNENFNHEDIIDALSYSLLGLEYYGVKYENNKR